MGSVPRLRLLVVDDDYAFVEYLRATLSSSCWEVSACLEPLEAGDRAVSERPDVVLLDFIMPEMSGAELLVWLKDRPQTRDIPAVVCSVNMDHKLASEVSALGGAEVLTKPVSRAELLQCLSRALGKSPGRPAA